MNGAASAFRRLADSARGWPPRKFRPPDRSARSYSETPADLRGTTHAFPHFLPGVRCSFPPGGPEARPEAVLPQVRASPGHHARGRRQAERDGRGRADAPAAVGEGEDLAP